MTIETLLSLLQFSDGLFPAGAYAHSFGLETFIDEGRAADAAAIAKLLRAHLLGSAGPCDAVFAVNALRSSIEGDLDACLAFDLMLDAIKSTAETRDASRQLGRQTLRIASKLIDHPIIGGFARLADSGSTPAHHAVVFGIIGAAHGWPLQATAAALLYSSTAAIVGAATRLVPLGQTQAQQLIADAAPLFATLSEQAVKLSVEDAFTFAPALEIAAMRHAQLEARLFKS
ncbi:MAG TPA: urease accessory UreF family protein [Candidatus Binataceae bacterium]|nr:urease accessory UreF family protein [Candidatus Binataceae bacterium]